MAHETTECPYCLETIKAGAIRCKHCRADLAPHATKATTPIPPDLTGLGPVSTRYEERETACLMTELVAKSLVVFDEANGRYRLLETVRQYARSRLSDSGALTGMLGSHLRLFLDFAEEAEPNLKGSDQGEWLDRLDSEHDNLRSALQWCAEDAVGAEAGLRMCGALWIFWEVRGHLSEGRNHYMEALAHPGEHTRTPARAKALNGAGNLATDQADYAAAHELYLEALTINRELGNRASEAANLGNLGNIGRAQGEYTSARTYLEQSLLINRELGNRQFEAGNLGNLGILSKAQGDFESAHTFHEKALAINRQIGSQWGVIINLNNIGVVAQARGDYALARSTLEQALEMNVKLANRASQAAIVGNLALVSQSQGDLASARSLYEQGLMLDRELGNQVGIAGKLEGMADLSVVQAQWIRACRLIGAAEKLMEKINTPIEPIDRERHDRVVESIRERLGETAFIEAMVEGQAMTVEQAVDFALSP